MARQALLWRYGRDIEWYFTHAKPRRWPWSR